MELSLARPVMALATSAEAFGPRMNAPLETFRSALKAAAEIESASPRTRVLAQSLEDHLDALDEQASAVTQSDILYNQLSLLSIAADALAWVFGGNPSECVDDARERAAKELPILRQRNHPSQTAFADSVENFLDKIKLYVESNVPGPLVYADGAPTARTPTTSPTAATGPTGGHVRSATPSQSSTAPIDAALANATITSTRTIETSSSPVSANEDSYGGEDTYATAFKALIDGPLAAFVIASNNLGGEVQKQAAAFTKAWQEEHKFLQVAVKTPKPDDIQNFLAPIATAMGEVAAVVEEVDPRGPLAPHCNALGESVAALGWVAVDEKATSYVGDMAGAGQFFIDKVKMGAKKTDKPNAHRDWANSLQTLFAELKAYVKEYHTQKLVWNPPRAVRAALNPLACAEDDIEDAGSDYVTAFQVIIDGPLSAFVEASNKIGGEIAEQATAFAAAWKAEAEFLAKAYKTPKPDDFQDMLTPIASKMGEVSAVANKVDPRGSLAQHCNAVGESVAALGWVAVDEKATSYVGDMAGAGQFFMDKVKMGAKKTQNPDVHREWAKALETVFVDLKAYVKEHHTQKLVWNPPRVTGSSKRAPPAQGDDSASTGIDYVSAFKALLSGPLATFVKLSEVIGGDVSNQAKAFASAWEAEAQFLEKAITMPKPDDIQDLLAPIATKMGEVGSIVEKGDPRGPTAHHCNAVAESVAALGWVAVDEKATSFVGDMAGAGQFFLDKVKMGAKGSGNPEAHRNWAKALEVLFSELKTYVKEYHTQKLVWNPPKAITPKTKSAVVDEVGKSNSSSDYVTAFKEIVEGSLSRFVAASKTIGSEVFEQAEHFAGAWNAESDFLEKATAMPKPDDIQGMLAPIASKMGRVGEVVEKTDPRGPLVHHCNAVAESVAALGWVAVDEKATSFVGDMAGAGQFFLDKVKMGARKSENPDAHREWASSLEILFADLKAYVKQYHTQKLEWNCKKP